MADVARLAGVSHQTVSRVLNGSPRVHPATRRRVQSAIEELGYRRNTAARALVTRSSRTIGVVSLGSSHYGPASTLAGVQDAAREAGYFVSVASMESADEFSVRGAVEHFLEQGVDGLVVVAPSAAAARALHGSTADVPAVMVASRPEESRTGVVHVAVDQARGAALATRHLLGLGHATVHHLAGPEDWFDAQERLRGWRRELEAAGAPVPAPMAGNWTPERGYEVGRRLLSDNPPTAVFVANDQMALGLLRAFAEAGLAVPDDVSVVGFDDVPGAGFFQPPLTTVRQDFDVLGRRCLEMLVSVVNGRHVGPALIAPELVLRSSTAIPRRGAREPVPDFP